MSDVSGSSFVESARLTGGMLYFGPARVASKVTDCLMGKSGLLWEAWYEYDGVLEGWRDDARFNVMMDVSKTGIRLAL